MYLIYFKLSLIEAQKNNSSLIDVFVKKIPANVFTLC